MEKIKYKSGYKYILAERYIHQFYMLLGKFPSVVGNQYVKIDNNMLYLRKGYAWDGASGPAIDTKNFMRGSLVHDALYQLIREGFLHEDYKELADKTLQNICIQDGMSRFRAWYVYQAVKLFGKSALEPKEIILAP